MRVLYFSHSVLNRGGDRIVLAYLKHLVESGHEVTIKTNVFDTSFAVHPAIAIKKIRLPSVWGTVISALISKFPTDCLIATIIPTAFCLYVRNRKKVVYLAQEYEELGYRSSWERILVRFLSRVGLTRFRIPALAVSSQLGQFLRNQYQAIVEIVPNSVDTTVFYPDPAQEYLSLKGGKRAILLFARRDARKGFDIALKVIKLLNHEVTVPLDVWVIGENMAEDIAGFSCRHFGFLNDIQLRRILSSADVFLYPSRTDGYGLIVAEAFACKCPVVTTTAVPLAEDGINALVSNSGSIEDLTTNVLLLLEDRELGSRLAANGYDFVQGMPFKTSALRFEAILRGMERFK